MKNRIISIFFILSFWGSSRGIDINFNMPLRHYDINDGLSNNSVTTILQDSIGFIWIGTYHGLNRFDGYEFESFLDDPDNPYSISDNRINTIYEDYDKNLWIGTNQGILNRFNYVTNRFHHYKIPQEITLQTIFQTDSTSLWIGYSEGVFYRFSIPDKAFTRYDLQNLPDELQEKFCFLCDTVKIKGAERYIQVNYKNQKYIGCSQGLYRVKSGKWQKISNDLSKKLNQNNSLISNNIKSLVVDYNDHLWIGTDNGLDIYDLKNKTLNHFYHDLTHNYISSLFIDKSHVLWLGIAGGGLYAYYLDQLAFSVYQSDPSSTNTITNNNIKAICEDQEGKIWIGTYRHGISIIDEKTGKIQHINKKSHSQLISNNIRVIKEDSNGIIWIGTNKGLVSFNPVSEKLISYEDDSEDISIRINAIEEITPGYLLVGTMEKTRLFDTRLNEYQEYYPFQDLQLEISTFHINSHQELWFGTQKKGLFKLNISLDPERMDTSIRKEQLFVQYTKNETSTGGINSNKIFCIYEDTSEHSLWIGTDNGLNMLDREKGLFSHYTLEDGLPDNYIYSVLPDDQGFIWLSTKVGLVRFNKETGKFKNFYDSNGPGSDEFVEGAYYKSNTGKMYFGGRNGLTHFYPEEIIENVHESQAIIRELLVSNKIERPGIYSDNCEILDSTIWEKSKIVLPHSKNQIAFKIASLNYAAPSQNRYAYMLKGQDETWVYTSAQNRIASYNNLKPGNYVFFVKSSVNDDRWSDVSSVTIEILPPFWLTKWAYFLYAVVLVFLLWGIYRIGSMRGTYIHKLKDAELEKKRIEERNQAKLQFFTNISHELRTPLSLILAPVQNLLSKGNLFKEDLQQIKIIDQSASSLLNLVNQILDFRKIDQNKIKLEAHYSDISLFIKHICNNFSTIANQKKISIEFHTLNECPNIWFDLSKMEKILNNLLSNAIKNTPEGGKIIVTLRKIFLKNKKRSFFLKDAGLPAREFIKIRVKDTGIGIKEDDLNKIFNPFFQTSTHPMKEIGTGIGLNIVKGYTEIHRGFIKVSSVPGKGSKFSVHLPVGDSHLFEEEKIGLLDPEYFFNASDVICPGSNEDINEKEPGVIKITPYNTAINFNKPTLVIVEDNDALRKYIILQLNRSYRFLEAKNGVEALELITKYLPDLVICDIMMPEMDGIELCMKIKDDVSTSHIPIIFLTARGLQENHIEGLETGADAYISKPFSINLLIAQIENLIESRKKLREKYINNLNLQPKEFTTTSVDEKFFQKLIRVVNDNLSETSFSVAELSKEVNMDESTLYRKIKSITNLNPSAFIKSVRLKIASEMLKNNVSNVSDIAFSVGFSSPNYFITSFKKQFGKTPGEYAQLYLQKPIAKLQ
ncbi:response regulator [Candidatus Poribacteria bacterium]|nr:response regulator [Candidatus Poribacteria bacterium]